MAWGLWTLQFEWKVPLLEKSAIFCLTRHFCLVIQRADRPPFHVMLAHRLFHSLKSLLVYQKIGFLTRSVTGMCRKFPFEKRPFPILFSSQSHSTHQCPVKRSRHFFACDNFSLDIPKIEVIITRRGFREQTLAVNSEKLKVIYYSRLFFELLHVARLIRSLHINESWGEEEKEKKL